MRTGSPADFPAGICDYALYRPDGDVCRRFFRAVDALLA